LGWGNITPSTTSSCRDFPRPLGRSWERLSLANREHSSPGQTSCGLCTLNGEKRHRRCGRGRGGCTSQCRSHQGRYQRARWKEPQTRRCQGRKEVAASSGHHSYRFRRPHCRPYFFRPHQGLFGTLPLPLGVCRQGGQVRHPLLLGKLGCQGCQGRLNAVISGSLVHLVDQLSNRRFLVDTGASYLIFPHQSSSYHLLHQGRTSGVQPVRSSCAGVKRLYSYCCMATGSPGIFCWPPFLSLSLGWIFSVFPANGGPSGQHQHAGAQGQPAVVCDGVITHDCRVLLAGCGGGSSCSTHSHRSTVTGQQ
jgi:hypothetical protein